MAKRKPRKIRPREKNIPKGYDSKWEYELHAGILHNWSHHTNKVPYVVEHTYEPDFERDKILIEAKGRFWDHAEYSKYLWIRKLYLVQWNLYLYFKSRMHLCLLLRKEKTVLKEHTLNGLKQIILNGILKIPYRRSGSND